MMEGQSFNVIAALALANATALDNRDRFAYFRKWSDEYVDVRTTGLQVGVSYSGINLLQWGASGSYSNIVALARDVCYIHIYISVAAGRRGSVSQSSTMNKPVIVRTRRPTLALLMVA